MYAVSLVGNPPLAGRTGALRPHRGTRAELGQFTRDQDGVLFTYVTNGQLDLVRFGTHQIVAVSVRVVGAATVSTLYRGANVAEVAPQRAGGDRVVGHGAWYRALRLPSGMNLHPAEPEDANPPVRRIDALIGDTPIVRLRSLTEPEMAEVWLKLESFNPAGSIKDRTALGMIADAEERGLLTPGSGQRIVEPTSGNTGIGLAFLAAVRGYRCTIVLPDTMSAERVATLRAYGAELEFTPGEQRMQAAIPRAHELAEELNAWMPNQFENPANPRYHERVTGPELWAQMQGRIDAFVWASGTGGSISGIGRYLKSRDPKVRVIAVEPARSAVLSGGERGSHRFQGMGPGFVPSNLDVDLLDRVIGVWEEDAFPLVHRLLREEGISVGMSSGATVHAALQVARELGPDAVVLALAADSAERYLSTELFTGTG